MKLSIRNTFLALLGVACVATADEATEKAWQALRRRVQQETNSSIVGGDQQTEREDWMVRFADGSCGGSLISEDLVLTAAHCVDSGFPDSVFVGTLTTSDGFEVEVDSSESLIHPLWTGSLTLGYDVAVIKLETRLTGADTIRVNNNCGTPCNGDELDAYGFGRTSDGGSTSPVLKTLETDYVSCGSTNAFLLVFAGDDEGVCQGDSGGPLVNSNGVQVGVASFVQGGCAQGNPDGFARVSTYYGWIRATACRQGDDNSNFDCSCVAGATDAARAVAIGVLGGAKESFVSAASFLGYGPSELVSPVVVPMEKDP